jgi:Bacteriocin-protection, YdeI or OmpD-Associated
MTKGVAAFSDALINDDEARHTFAWMGQKNQDEFLCWIKSAHTDVEYRQRIQAVIDMLAGRDVVRRN